MCASPACYSFIVMVTTIDMNYNLIIYPPIVLLLLLHWNKITNHTHTHTQRRKEREINIGCHDHDKNGLMLWYTLIDSVTYRLNMNNLTNLLSLSTINVD